MEDGIYITPLSTHAYSQSAQAWITQFHLQTTPCLPFLRKRSPDGATTAAAAVSNTFTSVTDVHIGSVDHGSTNLDESRVSHG